jgi:hypothetical protein
MRKAFSICSLLLASFYNLSLPAHAEERAIYQSAGYGPSGGVYNTGYETVFDDGGVIGEGPGHVEIGSWFSPPDYSTYFEVGGLWLKRHSIPSQTLAVNLFAASAPVMSVQNVDLDSSFEPGGYFTLGFQFDQVAAVEFNYFGFQEWQNSSAVNGTGNLALPGDFALVSQNFIFSDRIVADYSSRVHNAEANYIQTINASRLLFGFRYFNLDENFSLYSNGQTGVSQYNIRAQNHLIGGQVGYGWHGVWNRFEADVLGKIGVYGNRAQQDTYLFDVFARRNLSVETVPVSVIGEVALTGRYRITDCISVLAGYRFLWVNNVALGPGQLDFTADPNASTKVNAHDYLLFHGLNAGAEIRW